MLRLVIVTPVYNDWESFKKLIPDIDRVLEEKDVEASIIGVNDGSPLAMPEALLAGLSTKRVLSVEILELAFNMGHQRAIALGLAEVVNRNVHDICVVMDCDGEDKPSDLLHLIQQHERNPGHIVVAQRARRSEGRLFKVFYRLYKGVFKLLTGTAISHGNFSLIPMPLLKRLICMPDIWNHLAATIVRSRMALQTVPTNRGTRYAGQSKLNTVSLITLGLSAISVFTDIAFVRILVAAIFLACMTTIGIFIVVMERLFTDWAIPGWASTVAGALGIIFLQAVLLSLISAFQVLNSRSNVSMSPARKVQELIVNRKVFIVKIYDLPYIPKDAAEMFEEVRI